MTKDEALKLARTALGVQLDALLGKAGHLRNDDRRRYAENGIKAIDEALAQPEQESVMILPDGSAFGVMSFRLPDDHWIYAPNEYRDGEYEPIDLPKPIMTHQLRDAVVAAVRYAVRGATMRGQETDFDPDALVQNAVYALCGPYTTPPQRKPEQEPVAFVKGCNKGQWEIFPAKAYQIFEREQPLYTTPPQRPSRSDIKPLTHEEIEKISEPFWDGHLGYGYADFDSSGFARAIEAAHGIKGEA